MIDLHLKAPSDAEARAALPQFLIPEGEFAGEWQWASPKWALLPIGALCVAPAVLDPETLAVVVPAVIDSAFHLNIRLVGEGVDMEAAVRATGFVVEPKNPKFVWA